MEGLEISEIGFSDVIRSSDDFRLNSEFFLKEFLAVENYFNSVRTVQLNEVARIGDGDHSKFPDDQIEDVRYLQARDITNNFLEISSNAFVSKEYFAKNQRSAIPGEAILLSIMGTVGDITITPRDFEPCMCNRALAIVRDIKGISPQFLFSYLTTKHAFNNIERQKNGGVQQRINLDVLGKIRIPLLSQSFQNKIEQIVILAQDTRKTTKSIYDQAETLLLNTLYLADFSPSTEAVNIKSFKDSFAATGRLDAEYYQLKFDELEAKIAETHTLVPLCSMLTLNQRGTQPDYAEEGLPVINSKHVREGEVILSDNRVANVPDKETPLLIQNGDVLINGTGVGTIGRSAPYLHDQNAIPDNHVTILRTDKLNPIFLSVYLNSIAGKYQVDKYFKGSSGQIELYPKDIDCFYVPLVDEAIQTEVAALVQQSFTLKAESERLLEVAKRAVEIAIEQDEQVALAFIADHIGNVTDMIEPLKIPLYRCGGNHDQP